MNNLIFVQEFRVTFSFFHFQSLTQVIIVAIYCGQFKTGLCQLSVTSEKNQNLACAHNSIKAAVECGARLVVLPVSCPATHVIYSCNRQ